MKKPYVPKYLPIAGELWEVCALKNWPEARDNDAGIIYETNSLIYDANINPQRLMQVLLHEVKHIQQWESGMYQGVAHEMLEADAETTAKWFTKIFDIRFKRLKI